MHTNDSVTKQESEDFIEALKKRGTGDENLIETYNRVADSEYKFPFALIFNGENPEVVGLIKLRFLLYRIQFPFAWEILKLTKFAISKEVGDDVVPYYNSVNYAVAADVVDAQEIDLLTKL